MILVFAITGFLAAFVFLWFAVPDTCRTEADDLPSISESIDRAIALAAALPPEEDYANELIDTPEKAALVAARHVRLTHRADRPLGELTPQPEPLNL